MGWRNDRELEKLRKQRIDDAPPHCVYCSKVIPRPRRYARNVKYCREACRHDARLERQRDDARLNEERGRGQRLDDTAYPEDKTRRDQAYHDALMLLTPTELDNWVARRLTDAAVAKKLGYTPQAMGMARRAVVNDRLDAEVAGDWEMTAEHKAMLGPSDAEMRELLVTDPEAFEAKLGELARAFVSWRDKFFKMNVADAETETEAEVYFTREFHLRWIIATLRTIYTGGRQLILSPPRHGKTDLSIHFCVWLIIRNPNIRILWVGPNGPIADLALGQVKTVLATHEDLRLAFVGPVTRWEPDRRASGRLWAADKFTVANRTLDRKQPTMWSAGVDGKILSIDADYIVVDDPADPDDSQTPGGRDKISKRFKTKLLTRKMFHSGLAVTTSRVHIEDLYSEYVDSEKWTVIVDQAHDQAKCGLDLFDEHHNEDCVLFPEMNPLEHLRDQYDDVGAALFEMMYQNMPRPDGTMIFDPDKIAAYCYDYSRDLGLGELAHAVKLVAGLDPAARNIQAAFLWGIDTERDTDYMIDLETQLAGGIAGGLYVMRQWKDLYDCRIWVVEDNAYQKVFFDDPRVRSLATELELTIVPTTTGLNKHDPFFGVSSMAPRFHDGKVNLPMATREAQRKTAMYVRQLVSFTGETGQKSKEKSDIRMAAWFPYANVIRRWREEERPKRVNVTDNRSYVGYGPGNLTEAPWSPTQYPR